MAMALKAKVHLPIVWLLGPVLHMLIKGQIVKNCLIWHVHTKVLDQFVNCRILAKIIVTISNK